MERDSRPEYESTKVFPFSFISRGNRARNSGNNKSDPHFSSTLFPPLIKSMTALLLTWKCVSRVESLHFVRASPPLKRAISHYAIGTSAS